MSWTKKTSKQYSKAYIESYFAEKKVSNVSTIIADENTITDPIKIAKNVNSFFTSIGKNLQKKILPTIKTFTHCFKKKNSENFIIAPTTAD